MAKSNRRISKDGSVRIGARVYKRGDEKDLYEQISSDRAKSLTERGVLSGDWSGAKGLAEKELEKTRRTRARNTPMGRMIRSALEDDGPERPLGRRASSQQEEENDEDENADEPDMEGVALPIHPAGGEGGWYSFEDANGEEVLTQAGDTYKVRGSDEAEAFAQSVNGE